MTRDDIIRLAREADWEWDTDYTDRIMFEFLEEFAVLVAAAEREACAQVCDEIIRDLFIIDGDASDEVARCAAHIRARSEA